MRKNRIVESVRVAGDEINDDSAPRQTAATASAASVQLPQKPVASHRSHWSAAFIRHVRSVGWQAANAIS